MWNHWPITYLCLKQNILTVVASIYLKPSIRCSSLTYFQHWNKMNFSCGCLFDKKVKEPHFKKSKYFEDLSASFAINAKNEQLGAQ